MHAASLIAVDGRHESPIDAMGANYEGVWEGLILIKICAFLTEVNIQKYLFFLRVKGLKKHFSMNSFDWGGNNRGSLERFSLGFVSDGISSKHK